MLGTYRPTTLRLAAKHCPRAINHYNDGAPFDSRFMEAGTSAHAVLQAVAEAANVMDEPLDADEFELVSLRACERMIREGRTFEGAQDPPLSADQVWRGRDIARAYWERNPSLPGTRAELGLAVDLDWQPTHYGPDARLRLIADSIAIEEEVDEESAATVLVVTDYKSAWPTDASELDTVQLKAQAVLAYLHHGAEVDCVRQQVVNLRTGATRSRDLWLSGDGMETLERWRQEIDATMRALDASRDSSGLYPLSPGGGCFGCLYVQTCEAGREWTDKALEHGSIEERAAAYMALAARTKALREALKKETAECPVATGGWTVGFVAKDSRTPLPGAWAEVLDEWETRGGDAAGLLLAMNPGVTQLDKVAKTLYPEREDAQDRRAWAEGLTGTKAKSEWGIHPGANG